jgi:hypothetical protein
MKLSEKTKQEQLVGRWYVAMHAAREQVERLVAPGWEFSIYRTPEGEACVALKEDYKAGDPVVLTESMKDFPSNTLKAKIMLVAGV